MPCSFKSWAFVEMPNVKYLFVSLTLCNHERFMCLSLSRWRLWRLDRMFSCCMDWIKKKKRRTINKSVLLLVAFFYQIRVKQHSDNGGTETRTHTITQSKAYCVTVDCWVLLPSRQILTLLVDPPNQSEAIWHCKNSQWVALLTKCELFSLVFCKDQILVKIS